MATAIIQPARTVSGNQYNMSRKPEEATQTFLLGTPVQLSGGDAGVQAWDGATVTAGIAGISSEPGNNLTTTGTAKQVSLPGTPPNQPLAFFYARPGANDGKSGFYTATADTVFFGEVGPAQTVAATDVGLKYGMTKDTDGHWFVDKTKTGAAAVVQVAAIDTLNDTTRGIYFTFLPAAAQMVA